MPAPRAKRRTAPFKSLQELGRVLYYYYKNAEESSDPLFTASQYYMAGERPPHALEIAADQEVGSLYEAWRKYYGKPNTFWTKKDGQQLWRAFITLARLIEFDPKSKRDPSRIMTHRGYTLRSGRRILGSIKPTETREVYLWSSNVTKDRGVTRGLDSAIRILLKEAGMSLRQHEIDLVDAETGKRRNLN